MRHLLLEGDRGCGKSTLLLEELQRVLPEAGGFGTVRLLAEDGTIRGFCQCPASSMTTVNRGYEPGLPGMFMEITEGKRRKYLSVLNEYTLPLLTPQKPVSFFYLDEIGGIELTLPQWEERLRTLLCGRIPCIGVLKSEANSLHMRRFGKEPGSYGERYESFREFIKASEQISLLTVTPDSKDEVRKEVRAWLRLWGLVR